MIWRVFFREREARNGSIGTRWGLLREERERERGKEWEHRDEMGVAKVIFTNSFCMSIVALWSAGSVDRISPWNLPSTSNVHP